MPSPTTIARLEGLLLVSAFFGIILWKLFTGDIPLLGLFEGDRRDAQHPGGTASYVSAGRVQCVLLSAFVAMYLLIQVGSNPAEFPKIPNALLATLAGSHVLYLGGKAKSMLVGSLRDTAK